MSEDNIFKKLSDVKCKVEKKGKFGYVSWADAWSDVKKLYPTATFKVHERETVKDGVKYSTGLVWWPVSKQDESGGYVKVSVKISEIVHTQVHPILDNYNKPIKQTFINAFTLNTSIQRGLAKAIALHGLGLYVFRGEDLPSEEN